MAQDMWTMINRELSKLDAAKGGASDTPYIDIIRDTMRYSKENKAWKERENSQRQKMMTTFSKGLNTMYSNEDVDINRDRLQKYFDRHKGNMDESTLEMGRMTLDNFDLQKKKNNSFELFEKRQDTEMEKVINFTKGIEIDKEYTDEEWDKKVDEFRDVVTGYTSYTDEFAKKHSDRLSHPSFQHINRQLAHGSYSNQFILDSFFDEKKIDKVEYGAFNQAIASNSVQPIKDYNEYQSSLIKSSSKNLVQEIEGNVQLYKNFKSIQNNEIPVPKEYVPGEQTGQFYSDLSDETQEAIDGQVFTLGNEINIGDKTHIGRHGQSYVDFQHKGLFEIKPLDVDTTTTETSVDTTTTETLVDTTTPSGEKKAKVTDEDVSTVQLFIDERGYRSEVSKEFRKSKKQDEDITLKDFLENRPDLVKSAVKDSIEHKTIKGDAKKFLEKKIDLDKIGKTTYAKEDGNRIRYTTYYMSPDKKIISTPDLKNRRKDALNYLGATLGGDSDRFKNMHNELANAKLYRIKSVYDPYKREWSQVEIKEA